MLDYIVNTASTLTKQTRKGNHPPSFLMDWHLIPYNSSTTFSNIQIVSYHNHFIKCLISTNWTQHTANISLPSVEVICPSTQILIPFCSFTTHRTASVVCSGHGRRIRKLASTVDKKGKNSIFPSSAVDSSNTVSICNTG